MKRIKFVVILLALALVGGCSREADIASRNLSNEADNFQINRRIVFYNGITGAYMLKIEGFCSLGNDDKPREITVTCKTGPNQFKKHFLGLSDNVTYFAEQIDSSSVNTYQYSVVFNPSEIVPDVTLRR